MSVLEFKFTGNLQDHIYKIYATLIVQLNICELSGYNKNTIKDSDIILQTEKYYTDILNDKDART